MRREGGSGSQRASINIERNDDVRYVLCVLEFWGDALNVQLMIPLATLRDFGGDGVWKWRYSAIGWILLSVKRHPLPSLSRSPPLSQTASKYQNAPISTCFYWPASLSCT